MRLLFALVFLITPLRGVAAAALCIAAEHGNGMACEPGMAGMDGEKGHDMAPGAGSPVDLAGFVAADPGAGSDMPIGCGALGLCTATMPSIAGSIAKIPPHHPADVHPICFARLLKPGTRPAPPITPPRA